jgi:hypothetical protein
MTLTLEEIEEMALHHILGMGIPKNTPMEALPRAFADVLAHFLQSY